MIVASMRPGRAILAAAIAALTAAPAAAQIYRWTDDRGQPHYSEGLDSVPERHRATAVPLGFRSRAAPPSTPSRGEAATAGVTTIRYTPGQPIVVDVRINGAATARLLLDTGADRTLISPRALAAAGVSLTRVVARGSMTGVTGTDRVDFVVVDSLEVGQARVGRMPVAAYEMPQGPGDGLLGRDFLDRFQVTIDAAEGLVTLAPR